MIVFNDLIFTAIAIFRRAIKWFYSFNIKLLINLNDKKVKAERKYKITWRVTMTQNIFTVMILLRTTDNYL